MRQILFNYLNHYYHLSLCICLLTAVTFHYAGSNPDWKYSVWTGLATFLLYNYHSVLTLNKKELLSLVRTNIPFISLFILSGLVGLILLPHRLVAFGFFVSALIICILYFRRGIVNNKAGRDHYLLKPLMIGVVFGILTALMPYLQSGYSIYESILLTIGRVVFILVLAIIFDIGQVSEYEPTTEPTLPQKIGIVKTKIIAIFLLMIAAIIEGYGAWIFLLEFSVYMSFVIAWFFTFLLIIFAGPQKKKWYYLLLVDGMMLIPYFLAHI